MRDWLWRLPRHVSGSRPSRPGGAGQRWPRGQDSFEFLVAEQTVEVEQILSLRRQHEAITAQVEALVDAHPLYEVLTSMPGIRVRACARILTGVTGKHFAPRRAPGVLRRNRPGIPVSTRAGAPQRIEDRFGALFGGPGRVFP